MTKVFTDFFSQKIPLHNFTKDDNTSVDFELTPLEINTGYDSSVPHRHNYYEVFLFKKGGGSHLIDFQTFEVADHSIHFVSPGQVHLLSRNNGSEGSLISFSRDFFYRDQTNQRLLQQHPLLNNRSKEPIIIPGLDYFDYYLDLISRIRQELQEKNVFYKDLLRLYINELLYKSSRLVAGKKENSPSLVFKFLSLLEQKFFEWHLVKEYAAGLCISEKALSETLKTHTGLTAQDHISNRLLLESKRLLKFSELSIKEIAYQIGFEDPSHFTKYFRTTAGQTPSSFRNGEDIPS